jgi:uncharacterized protein (DUF4415 family)
MKAEYDLSGARRGPVISHTGKSRITIYLDDTVIEEFRRRADESGRGYQTMINEALQEYMAGEPDRLEATLRRVIREEMNKAA